MQLQGDSLRLALANQNGEHAVARGILQHHVRDPFLVDADIGHFNSDAVGIRGAVVGASRRNRQNSCQCRT
jgi:hypothetical protein